MNGATKLSSLAALVAMGLLPPSLSRAEQGVLVISVRNAKDQPVANVRVATKGDGALALSDVQGRARIRLAAGAQAGQMVTLQLLPPPADWILLSPYQGRTAVPAFVNETDNYVDALVIRRRDRQVLENAAVQAALAARSISERRNPVPRPISASAPSLIRVVDQRSPAPLLDLVSEAVARELGFTSAEIEQAMSRFSADPLAWKAMLLTAQLEFANRDPFSTVFAEPFSRTDIEFGIGSWRLRTGALQLLLAKMRAVDPQTFNTLVGTEKGFFDHLIAARTPAGIDDIVRTVIAANSRFQIAEPWKSRFRSLGLSPRFQAVQIEAMAPWVRQARANMKALGLESERSFAYVYDTSYQFGPGAIGPSRIQPYFAGFTREVGRPPDEREKLLLMANVVQLRRPHFGTGALQQRLRDRQLAFATGTGRVFGQRLDLEQAGLGLRSVENGQPTPLEGDSALLQRLESGWLPQLQRTES